ncbi:hypothetical protein RV12_GL002012 [Enterococcus quebecensis]|nr:hypothetical protein RV12_GL002012 [Enterococcus quebecensis]
MVINIIQLTEKTKTSCVTHFFFLYFSNSCFHVEDQQMVEMIK